MTEEVLNAAIAKLRAAALEQYALIKDVYHQPMASDTVVRICNAATQMAQLEGAMITLQQYAKELSTRTPAEVAASGEEAPQEVEVEEYTADDEVEQGVIGHEELTERSASYRKSTGTKAASREDDES